MASKTPTAQVRPNDSQVHARYHFLQSSLDLFEELQASLENSQKALLSRDLGGLEQGTREQTRLQKELAQWGSSALGGVRAGQASAEGLPTSAADSAQVEIRLRAIQARVLHLGRVQMALLRRAHRFLHAVSHLVAGSGANYVPPGAWTGLQTTRRAERGPSCRV